MAVQMLLELRWTERVPARRDLDRLNALWRTVDYDAPELTESGIEETWRAPLIPPACAVGLLHAMGFPCRWRSLPNLWDIPDYGGSTWYEDGLLALGREAWRLSRAEDVAAIHRDKARWLVGWSRRLAPWLPCVPRQRGPRRRRTSKAQRRQRRSRR